MLSAFDHGESFRKRCCNNLATLWIRCDVASPEEFKGHNGASLSTVTMRPRKTTEGRYREGIATRYSRTGYGCYTLQTRNVRGPATELTSIGSRRRDAAESGDLA